MSQSVRVHLVKSISSVLYVYHNIIPLQYYAQQRGNVYEFVHNNKEKYIMHIVDFHKSILSSLSCLHEISGVAEGGDSL